MRGCSCAVAMLRFVPFDPAHCAGARAHPSQTHYQHMLDDPGSFHEWDQIYSALDGEELIAVGGWVLVEGMRGWWVLFCDTITPVHFLSIHRMAVRSLVCLEQFHESTFVHLDSNNPKALRWAQLLGLETRRTDVLPDGRRMLRAESHVQH